MSHKKAAAELRKHMGEREKVSLSIVLPFFNEQETIGGVVEEIRTALHGRNDYEIILVNDGSTDLNSNTLERLPVHLVHHRENRGYGAAIKTGIRHSSGELIVILDADGTYPAAEIPRLLETIGAGADMAVGDRSHQPEARRNLGPWHRRLAKGLLAVTANYLAGRRIPDLNSGLRAFRRCDAERFLRLAPDGFSLTATLTLAYLCEGLTVEYVPITYRPRSGRERSKIRPVQDTAAILLTIIRTITYFHPLKVFLPAALAFGAAGVAMLIIGILTHNILDGTVSVLLLSGVQLAVLGLVADLISRKGR
ncbi:MAG: glycosyltransferase family 2 protein [Candidatus Sumerlaeia bacterium]|nr:glycosyltransferase family 2 protein [Candidatus Sumerlaeia bacterium]